MVFIFPLNLFYDHFPNFGDNKVGILYYENSETINIAATTSYF